MERSGLEIQNWTSHHNRQYIKPGDYMILLRKKGREKRSLSKTLDNCITDSSGMWESSHAEELRENGVLEVQKMF